MNGFLRRLGLRRSRGIRSVWGVPAELTLNLTFKKPDWMQSAVRPFSGPCFRYGPVSITKLVTPVFAYLRRRLESGRMEVLGRCV